MVDNPTRQHSRIENLPYHLYLRQVSLIHRRILMNYQDVQVTVT